MHEYAKPHTHKPRQNDKTPTPKVSERISPIFEMVVDFQAPIRPPTHYEQRTTIQIMNKRTKAEAVEKTVRTGNKEKSSHALGVPRGSMVYQGFKTRKRVSIEFSLKILFKKQQRNAKRP
jgi:hypothetical protein